MGAARPVATMAHEAEVNAVVFSLDGRWLASGSWDNTGRLWEVVTGRELARVSHGGPVHNVAIPSEREGVGGGHRPAGG